MLLLCYHVWETQVRVYTPNLQTAFHLTRLLCGARSRRSIGPNEGKIKVKVTYPMFFQTMAWCFCLQSCYRLTVDDSDASSSWLLACVCLKWSDARQTSVGDATGVVEIAAKLNKFVDVMYVTLMTRVLQPPGNM